MKEKSQCSNLKWEETEANQVKESTSSKKLRTLNEKANVEPVGKKSTSGLVVVGSPQNKGNEVIHVIGKVTQSSSNVVKLKPFSDDVV